MYENERKEMLEICQEMLEKDLVVGSAGNASMRVDDHIIITPSSVSYAEMNPEDFMVVDMNSDVVEGDRNPSTELPMHLIVYRNRADAHAIIHSHSVYASAMALLNMSLPPILDELVPKLGGEIRVTQYEMLGTSELGEKVVKSMELRSATLIANHGTLCCGSNLREALDVAILLERACRIYLIALQFGKPTQLPEEVIEMESDLWQMLKGY